MRNVAVYGSRNLDLTPYPNSAQKIQMEGLDLGFALVHSPEPVFNPGAPENAHKVLVKIRAWSCNYRDKALILRAATLANADAYYVLGSEFAGEVLEVGAKVTDLVPGDRVIPDGAWGVPTTRDVQPGLPTNHASKEYNIFRREKLIRIPPEMSDVVGAGFQIGGQTTYSMIRKLNVKPGGNILVTAAKSNTSLFAIHGLVERGANVYATSTSARFEKELVALGVKELIVFDPANELLMTHPRLIEITHANGGFDGVLDPFFDIHLPQVMPLIAVGGRYVTCGMYDQHLSYVGKPFKRRGLPFPEIMSQAMLKNVHIIGNCLGTTDDLSCAIKDHAAGRLPVVIDSVFRGDQVSAFLDRTYNDPSRFGKVVFQYD